jgi:cyclopropane fatty-acyl-phospholipid synthase-like methyltransferase
MSRILKLTLAISLFTLLVTPATAQWDDDWNMGDVPYVPTPTSIVEAMLELANVTANDVVYDLGCGDGRIVITAVQKYGARGVGIDLNPKRVEEAEANAKAAGVSDKAKFREGDLFKADFSEATVVTLYLLSTVNEKLKPRLLNELKPGTRVVSHRFSMGEDWEPEKQINVEDRPIYLWTIPKRPATAASVKAQ